MIQIFVSPKSWNISFPNPEKNKYPAAIMTFKDYTGAEIKIKMDQKRWDEFKDSINNQEVRK